MKYQQSNGGQGSAVKTTAQVIILAKTIGLPESDASKQPIPSISDPSHGYPRSDVLHPSLTIDLSVLLPCIATNLKTNSGFIPDRF